QPGPKRSPSFALGAQHAPLTAVGLSWPVVHHAIAIGSASMRRSTGLVAGVADDAHGALPCRVCGVGPCVACPGQLVADSSRGSDGLLLLDRWILRQHDSVARTQIPLVLRWPLRNPPTAGRLTFTAQVSLGRAARVDRRLHGK